MNIFRPLRADEIDCRIAQIKKDGLSLLLYKDARCDQNILDEVVGPFDWKREHTRDNKNCIVSIWDEKKQQWISKEDTGTESNTEREKGLASDSFKRACFNWGIGRELYTAPFIWIKKGDFTLSETGKCYDRFTVHGIGYTDGNITGLEIKNQKTGKIVFKYGEVTEEAPEKPEQPDNEPEMMPIIPPTGQKVTVETSATIPAPAQVSPVETFLKAQMKNLREIRKISAQENNELFNTQYKALMNVGLVPKKSLKEYTMEESENLIRLMYDRFEPKGTEIKQ